MEVNWDELQDKIFDIIDDKVEVSQGCIIGKYSAACDIINHLATQYKLNRL
jgi:hypothetical protein